MEEPQIEDHPRKRVKLEDSTSIPTANGNGSTTRANTGDGDEQSKREMRAGITHYVNPDTPGFKGVLKQRYTDFLVNEVSLAGKVLHLRSIKAPKKPEKKSTSSLQPTFDPSKAPAAESAEFKNETEVKTEVPEVRKEETEMKTEIIEFRREPAEVKKGRAIKTEETEGGENDDTEAAKISEKDQAELEDYFGDECVRAILRLYSSILKNPNRKAKDFRTVNTWPMDDKSKRGRAHGALRRIFNGALESTHADGNIISILKAARGGRGPDGNKWTRNDAGNDRGKGKLGWDDLGGEYLHFTLHKENKDTMEVISFIGSQLKSAPKNFQFAGTKDRRAVTVQRVSCYRQHAAQVAGLNKVFRGSKVGDFKYEKFGLELGALWGNEFVISLRDCHFPGEDGLTFPERLELGKKVVEEAVFRFQEGGFINYYGLQRFGSFTAGTDDIGMKLLQGDFEGAVELILDYHQSALAAAKDENSTAKISSDDCNRALALDTWKRTGNSKRAIELMPRKFSAETNLIRHLGADRNGTHNNMKDYQGALGQIQRNLRLMYVHAYQSLVWNTVAGKRWELNGNKVVAGDLVIIGDKKGDVTEEEEDVDEDGEVIIRPGAEDSAPTDGDFARARPLRKEEAESGKYNIFDVVLPLPGWDVIYPPNEIGTFYKEFMGSEKGGGLDPYDMRRKWKDYSLSGGYRKLFSRPAEGMTFEVKTYKEETEQLAETDVERMARGPNPKEEDVKMPDAGTETVDDKYIAVILKMKLGASQYATMALRELLKAGGLKSYMADFSGRGK